ncbi:MAG: hypothetical protein PH343_05650 [Nitrospira sp.]|nr:hypothetical protein [Nitrospira sp.]
MFRLIKMFIYLIIIISVVVVFIMYNGGEKLRWFGKKSEDVGKTIKEKTEYIGDKSDKIKENLDDKKEAIEGKVKTVVETAEKHGIIRREKEKTGKE